jgi:hypothetical protein
MAMSEVWNKVYKSDNTFFGEEPSNFALLFNHMKANSVKKVLELGVGHGRDTIFLALNGIEVEALDYSIVGINILNRIVKEKRLPINHKPLMSGAHHSHFHMVTLALCIHTCFLICAFQKMSFILYFQK